MRDRRDASGLATTREIKRTGACTLHDVAPDRRVPAGGACERWPDNRGRRMQLIEKTGEKNWEAEIVRLKRRIAAH